MELKYWAATDVGRMRDHNEDSFLIDRQLNLFVVCDGMGGHAAGEIASTLAIHEVRQAVRQNTDVVERFTAKDPNARPDEILTILEHSIRSACSAIYRRAQAEPEKRGMGTTCSVLLIAGERGFLAHVGDSRIYLLRQNKVHQITDDHSLINELIKRGKVTKDTIDTSPYKNYKNAVTRAVGVYENVDVDTLDFDVLPGDDYLLCTDGLHHYLKEPEIPGLLRADNVTDVPKRLVQLANDGGGHDNITAVVVHVEAEPSAVADTRIEELGRKVDVLKGMPLFKHLTYKEIMRILNATEVRDYSPGDVLMTEGEPGNELMLILDGTVKLHKQGSFITNLTAGQHLGEMALVDRSPRSASATAEARTRVIVLRRPDFISIIRKEAPLAVKLLWSFVQVLNERLRKTTADLSGARAEAAAVDLSDEVAFEDE
ncbi:MAG: Stp1/IreP family PP2C-type Ser/Thr phosphatase [Deltaproteobacteria bacterium]|nr:Stp1/IreP family PP2C-type Ser/Thr phosphatase [Deltaproteobacteria bacterium]